MLRIHRAKSQDLRRAALRKDSHVKRTDDDLDARLNVAEQFFGYEENGPRLIFQWHRIADLGAVQLLPSFLREGLKALPATTLHLIEKDND